ncbi:MAG: F0F1 ATP synthase subunit delta [Lachnospiraceae bacterium]|nr:F0F1 ATP synthase subunit delta [Lachnospiraceae bacterium]
MAKLVSQVYGEALFSLAEETGRLEQFSEELEAVAAILDENPQYSALLAHPQLDEAEKLEVFDKVFEGKICSELTGFFHILLEKGRFRDFKAIREYFTDRRLEHDKIGVAHVTSAVELSKEQKKKIADRLLETTDYVSMQMHYETDPALIGGLKIQIGDRVVDSSIQNKLNDMKNRLMKVQL